jgi:hypothetical protein
MNVRIRLACCALLAAALVLAACGGHTHRHVKMVVAEGESAFNFTRLPEMVATARTVVLGTVASADRADVIRIEEVSYTQRILRVRVERLLAGQPVGQEVLVRTTGWRQVAGEAETLFRFEGHVYFQPGDRGVLFLYNFDRNRYWEAVSDDATYQIDGPAIRDTGRDGNLARLVEALTVPQLEDAVDKAEQAIKRGEVHAQKRQR